MTEGEGRGFFMICRADMNDLVARLGRHAPYGIAVWSVLNSEANWSRARDPDVPISTFAELTGMSRPTVLSTLGRLEELEFIRIHRCAANRCGRFVNRYELLRGRHMDPPPPKPKENP